MTDRTIVLNGGEVNGDWFLLMYRKSKNKLYDFTKLFNKDDYWVYKSTGKQREVSYQDFLDFKYAGYIFFKKSKYNNIEINKWIDFLYQYISIPFFNKPFPPIEMIDKIKIKK